MIAVGILGGLLFMWGLTIMVTSPLYWFVAAMTGITWRDRYEFAVSLACLPAGLFLLYIANGALT